MNKPKWITYPDPADMDGFNLPGLELFLRGGQVPSVVRETGQNTIDNPDESDQPVEIIYRKYEIPTLDYPGREELISIIKSCIEFGIESGQDRGDDSMCFVQSALDMLSNDKGTIPMLEISDTNTTGIEGKDNDYKKPWSRMTDAIGISDGANSTRGGSRGIGKFAPLLISSLRTIFISTSTKDGFAFSGTAQFTSFQDKDNYYSAKLKYQLDKRKSIRDIDDIPKPFLRESIGTSIHVAGFTLGDNWMDEIITALLSNFYAAIQHKKLIIRGPEQLLNHNTIGDYVDKYANEQTKIFYKSLTEGELIEDEIDGFGSVELYVKVDEGFNKRIDFMRDKRMKIYDEKRGPLLTKNYAAVFICTGNEGSKRLRLMEGAEHVSWKPRNNNGDKAHLDRLKKWIFNKIKSFEPEDEDEESTISGTENLLPMVDEGEGVGIAGNGGQAVEEETSKEKIIAEEDELNIPEVENGGIIIINPDGSVSVMKRKKPKPKPKAKPKPKPDPDPDPGPGPALFPEPKPKPKPRPRKPKKLDIDQFETTIIKNDSIPAEYHLFIESKIDEEIVFDLETFAVAEHGERISSFNILKGAKYPDGSKIVKTGGHDQLKKVKINLGINKIILNTKEDQKYAFNIEGHATY